MSGQMGKYNINDAGEKGCTVLPTLLHARSFKHYLVSCTRSCGLTKVYRLGNAKSNALPECQIARLQVLANKLFPSKFWPIPFWIDTLCIPLRDAEARAAAIAQMVSRDPGSSAPQRLESVHISPAAPVCME